MQRYNGKNLFNNEVNIDFTKQRVTFKPVKSVDGKGWVQLCTLPILLLISWLYVSLPYLLLLSWMIPLLPKGLDAYGLFLWGISYLLLWLNVTTLWLTPKWREERWPIFQALATRIVSLQFKRKRYRITPSMVFKNQCILPHFNNQEITYTALGDFKWVAWMSSILLAFLNISLGIRLFQLIRGNATD